MTAPEVARIGEMDRSALLALWEAQIGGAPPRHLSAVFLRRILAFELQSHQHGGLSAALRRDLARVPADGKRERSPRLRPGARLIREWNGMSHVVDVTPEGYLWRGERWRSLSAIARAITGARWSGPRFFGLAGGDGR